MTIDGKREQYLEVGQRCWYYDRGMIHVVDIAARKLVLEGENDEFPSYTIHRYGGRSEDRIYSSSLIPCTAEGRNILILRLRDDIRRLKDYLEEVRSQENDHVSEVGDDI